MNLFLLYLKRLGTHGNLAYDLGLEHLLDSVGLGVLVCIDNAVMG